MVDYFKWNVTVKDDIILDNEFIHIQYRAYIINLRVVEGLTGVDESRLKVCNLVMKAFSKRLGNFKIIAEQLEIPSCSMLSLDVAQKYKRVFEHIDVEDGGLKYVLLEPIGGEWGSMCLIVLIEFM